MSGLFESERWQVLSRDVAAEHRIREATGISPLAARVMAARGIATAEEAQSFLSPSLDRDWHDPRELPGLCDAADRVERALNNHEVIAIFGDFDVDGMSSTCLLTHALRKLGATVHPYIPRRFGEGYGLSKQALERVIDDCNPDVIITVDNGIAAAHEVEVLLERGIDVVITDHHEPADLVPQHVAVCNPKLDHECVSCDLAGAGVALKLVHELGRRRGVADLWRSLTDVATLGTISDMMNLSSENRALVSDGIERMHHTQRPGLVALAAVAGIDLASLEADDLPFSLIPRLNAAGRMGCVDVAFKLLMSQDSVEATALAAELETINQNRRSIEHELADQVMEQIEASYQGQRVIVVGGEGWHEGVKGIVASRVVNRYHVPAILFSISAGEAQGSGRSVGSVNLFEAVDQCSDLLIRFGGHAGAVGVTLKADDIPEFRAQLEHVMEQLPDEQFIDTAEVTALVRLEELDVPTLESLQVLRPFGQGNPAPLFATTGVVMRNRARAGRAGEHLRFAATDGTCTRSAIMFRAPEVERTCSYTGAVDLVFEAVAETWQGRTNSKLMVRDILFRTASQDTETPIIVQELFAPTFDEAHRCIPPAEASMVTMRDTDEVRTRLQQMDTASLTQQLVTTFIGTASLLPAQSQALTALEAGRNTLCVMATGRGKSLIFQIHAVRTALLSHKASIFLYPLRALVGDQSLHLQDACARLGIVSQVLTGESSVEQRVQTYEAFAAGDIDILLTTPEFLALHYEELALSHRVGFLVIDEAHHAGTSPSGQRSAYQELPSIRAGLDEPVCLAVTATAQDQVACEICRLCGIDKVITDDTSRTNLKLDDCRGVHDREAALVALTSSQEKCIIYVNSRRESIDLARLLRHANPELAPHIAFYNAGLTRSERTRVEQAFRDNRLRCIISTSAFGEGVNLPDVRHVVLYHLPFGMVEFNQMSGRAGRDGLPATIHLMFNADDAHINNHVLATTAPHRDDLIALWRVLMNSSANSQDNQIAVDELTTGIAQLGPGIHIRENSIEAGLGIFQELGFLDIAGHGDHRVITMQPSPCHMELTSSLGYVEGMRSYEAFHEFCDWVLTASADDLLARIIKPLVPSFGSPCT